MAVIIKKNMFGYQYVDEAGHKGPQHPKKEKPLDLTKIQELSLEQVEELHAQSVGKSQLTERIDKAFDSYISTTPHLSEDAYVSMLDEVLDERVFVKNMSGSKTPQGLGSLMSPEDLACYLSTFVNKIKTHFATQSLNTPNLNEKLYINRVTIRFAEITAAKVLLTQKKLIQEQIDSLTKVIEAQIKTIGKDSEEAKKLEANLIQLQEEPAIIKPQVDAAQLILDSTLDATKKELLEDATNFMKTAKELEDKIRKNNEEIERLSAENEKHKEEIERLSSENNGYKNKLAELNGQIGGLQAAHSFRGKPTPPTPPTGPGLS